jgi:hypothetical protein
VALAQGTADRVPRKCPADPAAEGARLVRRVERAFNQSSGLRFRSRGVIAPSAFAVHRSRVVDRFDTPQQGQTGMASSGKRKTTMAKLNRESRLRERRLEKQAKKDARKQASAHDRGEPGHTLTGNDGAPAAPSAGEPARETIAQAHADPDR